MTPTLLQKSVLTLFFILISQLSIAQSENYKTAYEAYKNGESKKALEYFEKDVIEYPNSAYSHYYLSVLNVIEEKLDKAENHIDKAILNFPESSSTLMSKSYAIKGDIAFKLNNIENTFKYYALAIELRPKEINLYLDRGQYYFDLGQLDKAEADFNAILTIDSKNII
jgi:tetratricopeptide (TPR) repeat protein